MSLGILTENFEASVRSIAHSGGIGFNKTFWEQSMVKMGKIQLSVSEDLHLVNSEVMKNVRLARRNLTWQTSWMTGQPMSVSVSSSMANARMRCKRTRNIKFEVNHLILESIGKPSKAQAQTLMMAWMLMMAQMLVMAQMLMMPVLKMILMVHMVMLAMVSNASRHA